MSTVRGDHPGPAPVPEPPAFPGLRRLFPSAVVDELDPNSATPPSGRPGGPGRRPRRTARDWAVDFTCFLVAVLIGLAAADALDQETGLPYAYAVVDQLTGALACAAVWLRRRRPLGLAVAMVPVCFVSNTAGGAGLVALFTLAVHRPFRYVAWVAGVSFATAPLFFLLRPDPDVTYPWAVFLAGVLTAAVVGWGMFVRSKRQLMLSVSDRLGFPGSSWVIRGDVGRSARGGARRGLESRRM